MQLEEHDIGRIIIFECHEHTFINFCIYVLFFPYISLFTCSRTSSQIHLAKLLDQSFGLSGIINR